MTTSISPEPVFVDANILVFAHLPASPFHSAAVARLQALHAAGHDLWASRQVLREFLSAMTKPGVFTGSIPIASLVADVQSMEAQFRIAEDGPSVTANLLTLLQAIPTGGKQVHDANIVATLRVQGIPKLLTHNLADFSRFAAYVTIEPLIP